MGEKREKADRMKAEMNEKWYKFFESGKSFTMKEQKEMDEDNKKLSAVCREATKEWLEEKKFVH